MFHDYAPVFIIGMLNSFAEKTENGIIDFDTYVTDPEKYDGFLIYDKSNGKVVCDMCVDELHSDIVGYYDFFDGVDIRVIEDDGIFVDVDFGRSSIVVENGRWYDRPSRFSIHRHPENGATDFENHTIADSRGGVLMPRRRHSSVRERLKIYDCQVGKNQIICLRFANLRKVGRRHPTFLSPSASSGRHRLPGQKIGAAAPLFPVREGSRTATIAVLTDQGRSSSCKM